MPFTEPNEVIIATSLYSAYVNRSRNNVIEIELDSECTDYAEDNQLPPMRMDDSVADDGTVDFFSPAEPQAVTRWKRKLGNLILEHVVKPDILNNGDLWSAQANRIAHLRDFPHGYTLWVHKKGDRHTPRRDYYLSGSRHIPRFRSPEEFLLHLKWLMHGQLLKPGNKRDCGCQYCDPIVSQGDINRRLGLGNVSSKAGDSDDSEEERKKKFGKEKKKERRGNSSFDIPFKDYRKLPPPSNT